MKTKSSPRNTTSAFKRRPALNVSSKEIKDYQDQGNPTKFKRVTNTNKQNNGHVQFFAKLQQSAINLPPDTKQRPINLSRTQKKFERILRNIEPRGGSFYRFGFKSYEKTNKKLFAEVLNVSPSRMKGTMHVGEMWSTVQTTKFLRQNRIYINKIKLIDKLKDAKQQQQKDLQSTTTILPPPPSETFSRSSLNSRFCLTQPNNLTRFSTTEIANETYRELNRSIEQIHKQLRKLKQFSSTQRNLQKLKQMEDCIDKIGEIDSHYHAQIAEWM